MSLAVRPDLILKTGPKPIASMAIITMKCCCDKGDILMGQMGTQIPCPSCKKVWFVTAEMTIKVIEIRDDIIKELIASNNN